MVQRVLDKHAEVALRRGVRLFLAQFAPRGVVVHFDPGIVEEAVQDAIAHTKTSREGLLRVGERLVHLYQATAAHPAPHEEQPFRDFRWRNLMPASAHLRQAGIMREALMSTGGRPRFARNENPLFRDEQFNVDLLIGAHRSMQELLMFFNMMQLHRGGGRGGFRVNTGVDLAASVGRMSMMIADRDFIPFWDTRALPMNWTSDKFFNERQEAGRSYSPEVLARIRKSLKHLRREKISRDQRGEPLSAQQTAESRANTDSRFPYEMGIPLGPGHRAVVRNTGALRLDFSGGRRILDLVAPSAHNEDLSYENIVRYLQYIDGAVLRRQVREVFSSMGSATPFLRELTLLLVGIEGSQNNLMALHAPMVMDLASQGAMTWADALFTGGRQPTLENMPFFAYASDANQKGTPKGMGSAGPMQRQSDILRSGRLDYDAFNSDWQMSNKLDAAEQDKGAKLKSADIKKLIRGDESNYGYMIFNEVFLQKQFDLHRLFFATFFPEVLHADYGHDPEARARTLLLARRVLEYYFLHRFFGETENMDLIFSLWDRFHVPYTRMETMRAGAHRKYQRAAVTTGASAGRASSTSPSLHPSHPAAFALQAFLASMTDSLFMQNNCLIYAVTGAAGRAATRQDIYNLRILLKRGAGEDLGDQLLFNDLNIGIIMNYFGLRGTVHLFTGAGDMPTLTVAHRGGDRVYRINYANRHFTTRR